MSCCLPHFEEIQRTDTAAESAASHDQHDNCKEFELCLKRSSTRSPPIGSFENHAEFEASMAGCDMPASSDMRRWVPASDSSA